MSESATKKSSSGTPAKPIPAAGKRVAGPAAKRTAPPAAKRTAAPTPPATSVVVATQARPAVTETVTPGPRPRRRLRIAVPPRPPSMVIPFINWTVPMPSSSQLPWIAGLGVVAALEIIDWPVALLLAAGHTILTNSKNQQLRELAEGIEEAL